MSSVVEREIAHVISLHLLKYGERPFQLESAVKRSECREVKKVAK
jgi:hypothetical protein